MADDNVPVEQRQGLEELIGLLYADTPLEKIEQRACSLARNAVNAECVFLTAADGKAGVATESCIDGASRTGSVDRFIARAGEERERLFERGEPAGVAVPVQYGNTTLGMLAATDSRRKEFSKYDADLLDVYARYVAIARSNHAKLGALTHRLRAQRRSTSLLVAAALVITIGLALYGWFSTRLASGRTTVTAAKYAAVSSDHFERYVASAAQLSAAAAAVAPHFLGDRTGTERLLRTLLESAPSDVVYGTGVWYQPYAFSPGTRFYGPYAHRTPRGGITLTSMWSTPSYDYPSHAWYRTGAQAGSTTAITQPYFDVDHVYISAVHQIRANGRFVGVSSVDMTSQSIDLFLRHISSPEHITYLTTLDGHVVAFPNGEALIAFARGRHRVKRILDVTAADAAAFIRANASSHRIAQRTRLHPMPLVLVDSFDPAMLGGAPVPVTLLVIIGVLVWAFAVIAVLGIGQALARARQVLDVDRERSRLELEIDTHLQAERALRRAAQTDQLTGLVDRFSLIGAIEDAIRQRTGDGSTSDGLLLIDLNGLETINQQAGHLAGDEVLMRAASLIRRCCSQNDTPARLGGDEFAVLVRSAARERAMTIAECVQRGMSGGVRVDDEIVFVDASAGFAEIGAEHPGAQDVIRDADYALTHAKRRGRALTDFSPDLRAAAGRERELRAALRGALARGELRVVYQPIVRLSDRAIVGVEALARWMRGNETVLPGEFIPVAERTGLVLDIDRYIAQAAMRRIGALVSNPNLRLSLNVSALHFKSVDAFEALRHTLTQNGARHAVDVELTETAVMNLGDEPDDLVAQLHESGVGMHLDDFGTGYSSLAYLQHLHVDALKIDRSFVAAMLHEERSMQIVDAIVQLARRLRIDTIAEGIETLEQERALRDLGATMGQGHLYGEPMAAEALEEALGKQTTVGR